MPYPSQFTCVVVPPAPRLLVLVLQVSTCQSPASLERLVGLVDSADGIGPSGYKLDQSLRWSTALKTLSFGRGALLCCAVAYECYGACLAVSVSRANSPPRVRWRDPIVGLCTRVNVGGGRGEGS